MITVMVVDDSAVVRQVVCSMLEKYADIRVLGAAPDPIFALRKMETDWPDVILLDVEMPRMDGITFLRQIMKQHPTPTVICSSLTARGTQTSLDALAAGAVTIITKPSGGVRGFLHDHEIDLVEAIRGAARVNRRALCEMRPTADMQTTSKKGSSSGPLSCTTDRLIALGLSTGGTQALEVVLRQLPATVAGMVVVQHMPERFTRSFAERLHKVCAVEVKEAQTGDRVLPGRVLIAPGGRHMRVLQNGAQYVVEVTDGPLVSRHRPSVDVLFRSVAKAAGANALGGLMTGMGDDGARGLKEMRDAGARTFAQDKETSVVFGMPAEAIRVGAAEETLALPRIADALLRFTERSRI